MSANQLAVSIDDISESNAPVIYVKDGLKPFLQAVKEEVSSQVPDLSTAKGRDRIASLAAKVSKSKVAVEKPGREYLKRLKEMPKVVEAELREFVDAMDALRDETRRPLTEWQAAEDARIDRHADAITHLKLHAAELNGITAEDLADRIAKVEAITLGKSWEEFEAEAGSVKDSTLSTLRTALIARQEYEAQQAELIRLRAEAEAQAQRDRDAEIARAAVEKARRDADAQALAERQAAAAREQELIDRAAAAQREAEQKARDIEAAAANQTLQLRLQAEQAERQAAQAKADQLAAEQRAAQQKIDDERRHAEAAERAEQERLASIQRQAQAVEQAKQAEIKRQADAKAEEDRLAKAREADKAHKAKINRAALDAFVAGGMTEECAKQAITLIAQRKIPAIAITY